MANSHSSHRNRTPLSLTVNREMRPSHTVNRRGTPLNSIRPNSPNSTRLNLLNSIHLKATTHRKKHHSRRTRLNSTRRRATTHHKGSRRSDQALLCSALFQAIFLSL